MKTPSKVKIPEALEPAPRGKWVPAPVSANLQPAFAYHLQEAGGGWRRAGVSRFGVPERL